MPDPLDTPGGMFRFAAMIGGAAFVAYLILAALDAAAGVFEGLPKTPLKELNLIELKKPFGTT